MENDKILVIEDNKINLKLVRSLLQLGCFNIFEAEDAETGIALAEKILPNLILMDIQLPRMDGLEATQQIKKNPNLKHIPIIALTSYAMRGDEDRAIEAGCDGYITKPIDTRHFLSYLKKYLRSPHDRISKRQFSSQAVVVENKTKILVVDDEPGNVKLLRFILISEKYDVLEAQNGKKALELIQVNKVDLILLDVMMPEINGFELTKLLKQDDKYRNIPIILVTALSSQEDKERGIEAGADEFITKPVNKTELTTRIKSMLQLKQYQEQLNARITVSPGRNLTEVKKDQLSINQQKVLLVEDEESDIKLILKHIENEPYKLLLARTGEEAIEIAQKEKVDLIIQDLLLPGMSGFEVCHYVKNNKQLADIQIVMITCLSDLETKLKGVGHGVDDFLVKPIDGRELKARINVLLRKKAYLDQLHSHYDDAMNLAITDGLTGLYNQSYFKRYLDLEIQRATAQGYPIAVVMMDLDNFKKYNDDLGHPIGDIILKEFANIIKLNIRDIDLPARYGGEEFAVVFPYVEKETILRITERIQNALRDHKYPEECNSPLGNITTSIGVAFCPADAVTSNDLIDKADYMLYRAKKAGKNRTCIAS
jgi:two-component system cell cycle response regulator